MEDKDFKELLKTKQYKKIIYMHCNRRIKLTSKQLEIVIKLKQKEE
jgi:hypothetical protein